MVNFDIKQLKKDLRHRTDEQLLKEVKFHKRMIQTFGAPKTRLHNIRITTMRALEGEVERRKLKLKNYKIDNIGLSALNNTDNII